MAESNIRTHIQNAMRAAFPHTEARLAQYYYMQEYHLGWRNEELETASFDPGKLLRPQLALLTCAAVGGSTDHALPLAAGIQLIHDFSLIHDDIEDNSDTRRGRTTVWKLWGLAHGINVGDGMFVIAHLAIHRLSEAGVSAEVTLEVLKRFDQTILTICEGQYLDLSFEGNLHIDENDHIAMISRKTAALIAAATGLGSIVGGADLESSKALFEFGQNLGITFQLEDDILGIWGDSSVTGKPDAADIYQRKVTLPVIHALHYSQNWRDLADIYRQEDELSKQDVQKVLAILDEAESRAYSEKLARIYHEYTLRALERVRPGSTPDAQDALAQLRTIADRLLGRKT
jgi:geranylgeranyl diphosphate synthase type I